MASTYAFGNEQVIQRERLRTLEMLLDPGTIAQLERRGVRPGWRCLEVGAGGGSIAAWLCDRVAPDGSVTATDLDTTVLSELSRPNLEIRVHDLREHDLPTGQFDLVHLRLVLAWLRDASTAIERIVAALKPGGWLVAEEMDFVSAVPDGRMDADARGCLERVIAAHNAILARHNQFDPFYGRRVAGDLAAAGLTDRGSEGSAAMWRGGEAGGRIWQLTLAQLREPMVKERLIDSTDVDTALALFGDARTSFVSPLVMAAWGRRA